MITKHLKLYLTVFIIVLLGCLIYLHFTCCNRPGTPTFDFKKIDTLKEQLKNSQDSLWNKIEENKNFKLQYDSKIDSLNNLKSKTKIVYVKKYAFIDTISNDQLINEFTLLFAKNNIK
jgi:hypothetical protein